MISKLQYKNSEKGEFHHIAERNLEDTQALIKSYPWARERNGVPVQLTCPSVTLEHPAGSCLKIGPYFSSKFALYLLDRRNKVYVQIAGSLEEVCFCVANYVQQEGDLPAFEKYSFTIRPADHFRTKTFRYTTDTRAKLVFFTVPLISTPPFLSLLLLACFQTAGNMMLFASIMTIFLLSILWAPLLYLYFDYRKADGDSYLEISRGHDEFVYSSADQGKVYSKQEVIAIDSYGTSASRSPWFDCRIFVLTMKGGEQVRFTSLLISESTLIYKFPDQSVRFRKKYFPTTGSIT
ncbi:MAG: hypothetical protein ACO1NU_13090 [Arcticibacter sp.]